MRSNYRSTLSRDKAFTVVKFVHRTHVDSILSEYFTCVIFYVLKNAKYNLITHKGKKNQLIKLLIVHRLRAPVSIISCLSWDTDSIKTLPLLWHNQVFNVKMNLWCTCILLMGKVLHFGQFWLCKIRDVIR